MATEEQKGANGAGRVACDQAAHGVPSDHTGRRSTALPQAAQAKGGAEGEHLHDAFCVGACMTGVTQYNIAPCRACWIFVNTRLLSLGSYSTCSVCSVCSVCSFMRVDIHGFHLLHTKYSWCMQQLNSEKSPRPENNELPLVPRSTHLYPATISTPPPLHVPGLFPLAALKTTHKTRAHGSPSILPE